jgi:hypothetical protein
MITSIVTTHIVSNPLTVPMDVRSIGMSFKITEIALLCKMLVALTLLSLTLVCLTLLRLVLFSLTLVWSALLGRTMEWNISTADMILIPMVVPATLFAAPVLRKA